MIPGRRGRASSLLPVEAIAGDALRLRGGRLRAVLECATLAFGIKGEIEQRAIVDGWRGLLNSLAHPVQVVILTRRVDAAELARLPDGPAAPKLRAAYGRLVNTLAAHRDIVDRRYFLVAPWDPPATRRRAAQGEGSEALEQRVHWLSESLRRLDLEPRRLGDRELAALLRDSLDPGSARQPIAHDDTLDAVAELIAPAALAERAGHVELPGRRCRSLVVVRYPSHLQPGWLADIASFDGDLDLALQIAPAAGGAAMAFLERRVAELSSTVRVVEDRGGRMDPYRRVALADALALRDELAQGTERLFDAALTLTLWAETSDELESRTRSLEALLGARLVHTRRLIFQMRDGLTATLPLCDAALATSRILSTGALAATFPFAGNDVRSRTGLLYGVNPATKGAVVLDRFSLQNHNAVVFATSGAGKSYLVKVELARASIAGTRCLVIDPEGEYASLLGNVGAIVAPVRPGIATGLDAFALPDGGPGALSVRISTLLTLIDLLAGGLHTGERAGVEEALATAYARAGFVDGGPVAGLVPPRLTAVHAQLEARQALERVANLVARYVSGPNAWLFEPAANGLPSGGESVVYVLAGLPEEARAAAMFIVLDRIWTDLAQCARPTLVVVDEAWWLMRHPDTASFLFRLVKTARKRRAGLTLVTQDVADVLAHPEGEAVITNSALQILMKQAPQAMPRLAELFRLTQAEQSYLLGAQQGEALLVAQGRRVPLRVVATDEEARLIEGRASVA